MEAYLGGLFENYYKAISMETARSEIVHQQPPTPVATDNAATNGIANGTGGNI